MQYDIWVHATKERPTMFTTWNGELTEDLSDDVKFYIDKDYAEQCLKNFDEPEKFMLLHGTIEV